jgi:hypothetical protein
MKTPTLDKQLAWARADPRQRSFFGEGHEQEIQEAVKPGSIPQVQHKETP